MTALQKWDEPRPVRLTIEDFLHLDQAGAFRDYAKTELIEGTIVAMNAQFSMHGHVQSLLFRRLADAVDEAMHGYRTWIEVSVAIPPADMPEPDIVVTRFEPSHGAPVPVETVALVVEVAGSTASYDRTTKARVYAGAAIAEYWVADIQARSIHQMWRPESGNYAEHRRVAFGERVTAATIDSLIVDTAGL